ncbi:hypothetical protein CRYUN_Cryun18bG0139600 [Craigia yunnanensis]
MGRRKNMGKKEEIAEDYCFFCKDGGLLRVCDYKNCLKSFHPQCVGRDNSLLETEERWFCGWHFCFICSKPAKFHCFCCPSAVCGSCLCDAEFALVKGKRGLCNTCSELALLIEDNKDVNSNGVKIDFNDRETYEFFFKGYWELVKEKEGLTSKQVLSSDSLLKDGKNYDFQANNNYGEEDASDFEDDDILSDYDDLSDNQVQCRKRKKGKLPLTKRKGKPKKKEFLGWASKQLIEFLMSIGKNVMQELTQYDVATIVTEYCKEHKLFHPEKKKKVICDERLQSFLGRKSVNRNGIYKLLTVHFAENMEQSEDSVGFSSNEDDDNVSVPCKRQRKSSPDRKFEEKEIALNPRQGYLAAIVSGNIKLVYLKRSLVQELAKQLDTFYGKMIGSFVRVKSDPNDYFQKNSHMLVQVKDDDFTEVIMMLIFDDFTDEEIEDLNWRMRTRVLERPTATPSEQSRLIHDIPEVVADVAEPEPASEDSPREDKNDGMDAAEGKQQDMKAFISGDHCYHSKFISTRVEGDETERNQFFQEVKQSCPGTFVPQLLPPQSTAGQTISVYQEKQHSDAGGEKRNQPVDVGEHVKVENQVEVIELSDDEIQDARVAVCQQTFEDRDCSIWYCIGPRGNIKGPYSMKVLKEWIESSCGQSQFKVLKSGQRPEKAILLTDAIRKIFNS